MVTSRPNDTVTDTKNALPPYRIHGDAGVVGVGDDAVVVGVDLEVGQWQAGHG